MTFMNVGGGATICSTCSESDIEKQYAQLCKKKLVLQLKRIDQNVRKLDVTAISKPTCESLNYTISEDKIVVIGDGDEEFSSSQVFDDQKHSVELPKGEVQDATREWPVFHNVVDVDEIVLEEEEVKVDDDLFKRLLEQDCKVEPLPLLCLVPIVCPQQLPVETGRRDVDLEEETLREMHLPNIAEVKPHLSILDDPCDLTANQKKQITDKSKGKLKAISEKEKMFAIASKKDYLNAHAGTFLMEGAKSTDGAAQLQKYAVHAPASILYLCKNIFIDNLSVSSRQSKCFIKRCNAASLF
jgi:hypothetical protein